MSSESLIDASTGRFLTFSHHARVQYHLLWISYFFSPLLHTQRFIQSPTCYQRSRSEIT